MFLLPVQLSVLGVPSPAVTPTNLLYNVVARLGALLRYRHDGSLYGPLTRRPTARTRHQPAPRAVTTLAPAVGTIGGVYGIGGGSILGPVLVGRGMPVAQVAPAALASTFLTSLAGAGTYGLLALTGGEHIAPDWLLGLSGGLGGLAGGYLGARLQPRLPEGTLRLLLGTLAALVGARYALQALTQPRVRSTADGRPGAAGNAGARPPPGGRAPAVCQYAMRPLVLRSNFR